MSNILITGATGHLGKSTIDHLLKKGVHETQIVALARNDQKAAELKAKGVKTIAGDYERYDSLVEAFKGIDTLFFISANDLANRASQHENIVRAATEANIRHIVYTSFVRRNEKETSPISFITTPHLKTERWLKESGITCTLLYNNLYMEYVPIFMGDKVLETGTIYLPASKGKAGVTLREEMAEASAAILASSGHENKTYNLTNIETYSYADIAGYISEITGTQVKYISPSVEEYTQTLTKVGVPPEYIAMNAGFALAQAQGEFDHTSNDLETLLGRKPTSMKEFLKSVYVGNFK